MKIYLKLILQKQIHNNTYYKEIDSAGKTSELTIKLWNITEIHDKILLHSYKNIVECWWNKMH